MISTYISQTKASQKIPKIPQVRTVRQFYLVLLLCGCLGSGVADISPCLKAGGSMIVLPHSGSPAISFKY